MAERMQFVSHEQYIESATPQAQEILLRIQALVEAAVPDAKRCISYNMPAFKLGKTFFYFAAFKKHIGIYPPVKHDQALIAELQPYRNEKGNLAFPFSQAMPYELIGRVVLALARQYGQLSTV